MSELEKEVQQLREQVQKMQKVLASTGQQVMQLQMHQHKKEIDEIGTRTKDLQNMVPAAAAAAKPVSRNSEYVTESDLADMVMELQGQLTVIDQRSIGRTLNSRSTSRLVSLPNADGEKHPQFPNTLEDLQKLGDNELFDQWNHFEMLDGKTLDDLLDKDDSVTGSVGNQKLLDEIYTSFAEYIGVNPEEYPRIKKD